MNDDDAKIIISTLASKLKDIGLDWVLEEYFVAIRAGRVETKQAKYEYWNDEKAKYQISGKPKKVAITVPFTPQQRAESLVDAVENCAVVPHEVAIAIHDGLKEFFPDFKLSEIEFRPDLESISSLSEQEEDLLETMQVYHIEFEEEISLQSEVEKLRSACAALKEAIN